MKLSVIIPIYNCEKFLKKCLNSICCQTYSNLEIILVDDGSTDNSGKICDSFASKDSRIIVIHQNNAGVSAARNKGMQYISGEFVSFIDGDDYLEPCMFETLINLINEHDADIAHCGYRRIVDGKVELQQNTQKLYIQDRNEALYCMISGKLFHCGLWNKIYRYTLIQGLSFDETLKINEDILFNFQLFSKAHRSVYIDIPYYNYVVHKDSACGSTAELKKALDSSFVNRLMLDNLTGSDLECIARSRYMRSLSICYREYGKNREVGWRKNQEAVSKTLWNEAKTHCIAEKRMIITAFLIRWFPWAYSVIYTIYASIRKPKWEPDSL